MKHLKLYENYNSSKNEDFTVDKGIAVQKRQLDQWALVLKPEVHADLVKFITRDNDKAKNGYDIARGSEMAAYIENYHLGEDYR